MNVKVCLRKIVHVLLPAKLRSNIWLFLVRMSQLIEKQRWRERKITNGSLYPNDTYYVIRCRKTPSGLGALWIWWLNRLDYADKMGYIPIIDWGGKYSNFWNIYMRKGEVGKINVFQRFYSQPTWHQYDEIQYAQNVILGDASNETGIEDADKLFDDAEWKKRVLYLGEKYVHLNGCLLDKLERQWEQLVMPTWKVLALVHRGTDYRKRKIVGEHKMPSIHDEIALARKKLREWGCDHIYVATEDSDEMEIFKKEFGEILIVSDRVRYSGKSVLDDNNISDVGTYERGEAYMIDIFNVSKCTCLIASRIGLLHAAIPLNGGRYEHEYIFDLGLYSEEDYDVDGNLISNDKN